MSDASAFSPDYVAARARFRSSAMALDYPLQQVDLGIVGPEGEALTIDVARVGADTADQVVVVSSGLHGVEGFFGSAVQAALLEDVLGGYKPPKHVALVLIHALNPYGFAWSRRVNEDNVDLNRNFLRPGEDYVGSPLHYAELDPLLNPEKPPGAVSAFLPRAGVYLARYGMPAMKNAVAGGQYDFPMGLFFGGSGPCRTVTALDQHLGDWLGQARRVLHIDFHTGLGEYGTYKLLADHPWGGDGIARLAQTFGSHVEPWEPKEGVSYEIRGGLGTWCKARFPSVDYDVLCAEFGTVNVLKVIAALHHENRAHHYLPQGDPKRVAAKKVLRETFCPPERAWRDQVVAKGLGIVQQALEAVTERTA